MTSSEFDRLAAVMRQGGSEAVLSQLADYLRDQKKHHELFEVRKMQVRLRLGLPLLYGDSGDELDEPQRQQLEDGLIGACQEVGMLLLQAGRIRDGWVYLRPVGDREAAAKELARIQRTDENMDEMVEVLLSEGVDPGRGYALVLEHYGTCNAITTYESQMYGMEKSAQQAAAELLLRQVHRELLENVKAHIAQHEDSEPTEAWLGELLPSRDWLTSEGNYHIDTSHLASTVRISRILEAPELLRLALDLSRYGLVLSSSLQYPGEEPFVESYPSHELFFSALLGDKIEEAIQYFRTRAENVDADEYGTAAVETYIQLLARIGRIEDAISAWTHMFPEAARASGLAPSLFELCQRADDYQPLMHLCRQRQDLLGFATGLLHAGPADDKAT